MVCPIRHEGSEVYWPLTIFRFESIDPDDRRDTIADVLKRARTNPASVRMDDKANVAEVFPFRNVDNIREMGVEK
jgi:hypothetical protein